MPITKPWVSEKRCTSCLEVKPIQDFYGQRRKRRDGTEVLAHLAMCKPCHVAYYKAWRQDHPEVTARRDRDYAIRRKYGLSVGDVELMTLRQGGRCAICGVIPLTPLHIDHEHSTGVVRGLLCSPCNRGLGIFDDQPETLEAAARYLRKAVSTL